MTNDPLKPATIAAQAAGATDGATAGVVPGIHLSTTYLRDPDYELMRADNKYGRDENDTVRQAEEVLRQLEGAAATPIAAWLFRGRESFGSAVALLGTGAMIDPSRLAALVVEHRASIHQLARTVGGSHES